MNLSDAGAALIAEFEGFRSKPYRDAVGVWTIGYGSTKGVGPNTPAISVHDALERMKREVSETYGAAINDLGLPLSQNQFDALVSFVYNVGPGGVAPNTGVGKHLRAHEWRAAAAALLQWDKAGGRTLAGLARRRKAERALFLKPAPEDEKWAHYTEAELRWIHEYDSHKTPPWRKLVLQRVMTEQRKRIWRAAQPVAMGGDSHGWEYANRRKRYESLKARTS